MFHLPAKKSLGQHFLIDPNAHERIVKALAPNAGDIVIEIGPGTGLLTKHLLKSPFEKLIAFELDKRAVPELREMFSTERNRFEIREQDFLECDLAEISRESGKKLRVVGNIPYYITSPIIFKLIDERAALRDAILLVQREVAERLTAKPRTKSYGIPTVLANFFGEVTLLFRVPRGAFRPMPNVDSAVVRINFAHNYFARVGTSPPNGFDEAAFRKMVRTLFGMRRKTIRNNLKSLVSAESIHRLEENHALFLNARAEELSIEDFLDLSQSLSRNLQVAVAE